VSPPWDGSDPRRPQPPAEDELIVRSAGPTEGRDLEVEACLVRRAQAGDRQAFGQLYRGHLADVYHFVLFRVADAATAEDVTQDVFVSAFQALAGLREPRHFRTWLMRIAHNRVLNHWRARSHRPEAEPLPDGDRQPPALRAEDPALAVADAVTVAEVLRAAHRLTPLQREVIAMRFVAGLSVAETAELLGRTANAIHNLQHHALAALRRELSRELPS
jgi:RNA polymerase sigma-70 factor (ECF subfamily)